jgi:serine/threonine protein kinase
VCKSRNACACTLLLLLPAGVITTPQDFIAMLEQMVGCQYEIPDSFGLSEDCKDLMRRMLMPEPHKRISTEDILAHRWFNTNLPPEAATMNDRCLQLGQLAGVPDPDTIRQIVCTATSGGSSSFAGTSSHAAASAGGGGPSKGSGYSSGTQMHGTSGHQQQQQASACVPAVQQLTQQQLQQQQQQLAQMSWAQQQQAGAGAYALQHDTQQHVQPQAQPQQGQQQYYQQYM